MLVRRLGKWTWNALAWFGLLSLVVMATPLTRWWAEALARPWHEADSGDVLVVLAGSDLGDALGESSYLRAVYAVRAMRRVAYRKVVVSGDSGSDKIRDFIVGHGVDASRVEIEGKSIDTHENAEKTAALLGPGASGVVLLTSDYHVYRSVRAFERAGLRVRAFPAPDALKRYGSPWRRWGVFWDLCLETGKLGYYRFRGWV